MLTCDARRAYDFAAPLIVFIMLWTCPACRTLIQHHDAPSHAGVVYRCPTCRLELVVDDRAQRLVVAPFSDSDPSTPTK